jgi:hypothetical protein
VGQIRPSLAFSLASSTIQTRQTNQQLHVITCEWATIACGGTLTTPRSNKPKQRATQAAKRWRK